MIIVYFLFWDVKKKKSTFLCIVFNDIYSLGVYKKSINYDWLNEVVSGSKFIFQIKLQEILYFSVERKKLIIIEVIMTPL